MRRRKEEKAASMGMTLEEYEAHLLAEKQAKKRKASAGDGAGLTAEGRKRISEATRKRWQDPKFREAYSKRNRGRKHSDKTKAMIAEKVRLLWQHNETYRNSSSQPRTEEQKQRISATLRARWQDDEFRAMMQSRIGERDAAWKERLSESIKLKWQDPNYRKAVTKSAAVRGATRSGARTTRSSPQQQQQRRKQQQQRRRLSEEEKQQRAEERQRKREAVLEQRRQQKLEKQRQKEEREEALRKAKLAATDESKRQSLQSIMGRELWTEEKVPRLRLFLLFVFLNIEVAFKMK